MKRRGTLTISSLIAALTHAPADTLRVFVTQGPVVGCRSADQLNVFNRVTQIHDLARIRELIASGTCVAWPKGTRLYLDRSVEGGFSRREKPEIEGVLVRVFTISDPNIYFVTSLPEIARALRDSEIRAPDKSKRVPHD